MSNFLQKLGIPFSKTMLTFLLLDLSVAISVLVLQRNLPPVVPLLYGLPKGADQLVPVLFLSLPALTAAALVLVNGLLLRFIKDSFSQKVLLYLVITTSTLALITTFRIIALVGSF